MVAPSVAAVGTSNSGTNNTRTPGVPSGVVTGSFVMIFLASGNVTPSGAPSGFSTHLAATGTSPSLWEYYKYATGSDSGTYTVPADPAGLNVSDAVAMRIIDVHASTPFHASTSASAVTTSATTGAVSLTGVAADSMLIWFIECTSSRTVTAPSGFTLQTANISQRFHIASKSHGGGDTGSITGTLSSSATHRATLVAVAPAPVDGTVTAVAATATASALAPIVTGAVNATVGVVTATAAASAPAPTAAGVQNVTVTAVTASATANANEPTIGVVQHAGVSAVVAIATAAAYAPAIAGAQNAEVAAPVAVANAEAQTPTVTLLQSVTVAAVAATATVTGHVPYPSSGNFTIPEAPRARLTDPRPAAAITPSSAKAVIS